MFRIQHDVFTIMSPYRVLNNSVDLRSSHKATVPVWTNNALWEVMVIGVFDRSMVFTLFLFQKLKEKRVF